VSGAPQFDAPDVADRPGRFAVGVIGTGRVGAVLGAALARAGHRVVAASAVSDRSRRRAAELLPDTALLSPPEVAAAAELLVLAVPDDVLPELVVGLTEAGLFRPGQTVLHPSGRHGIGVLEAARIRGVLPLALHPVMSFTGTDVDLARLTGCSFGVTAPEAFRPMAEALVVEMGGEPEWIAEADRPLYHAALAFGANYLTTLVAQSAELLSRAGVSRAGPDARAAARRHPGQFPAIRRRRADRPGRPRGRGHGGRPPDPALEAGARLRRRSRPGGQRVPGDGPADGRPRAGGRAARPRAGRGTARGAQRGRWPMTNANPAETLLVHTRAELEAARDGPRRGRRA
jgi:predicted short-subunit dehydrogenase-like oxidoreductase (DUF2520 family)